MPSKRFILTVLLLLSSLHGYIGWRLLGNWPGSAASAWTIASLLLVSVATIPAGLLARRIPSPVWSTRLAWTGLFALGWFSSLLILTLLRDILLPVAGWFGYVEASWVGESAQWVLALATAASLVGLVNVLRRAKVVTVDVPIPDLPADLHGFTIAQISDIHVGPTIKRGYLQRIVDKVNHLEADVIAITGDLVDGTVQQLSQHTQPLSQLKARHGTYFVTGNHEYYSGAPAWIEELERLGIDVLQNRHVLIPGQSSTLLLAGVNDYTAHQFDETQRSDPHKALEGSPDNVGVKVLLAHQPRTATAAAAAGFDLQLSGHTHGGQFWPWNLFVPMQQPFTAGLKKLEQLWVYTSRGTGYWGPPKRLGVPSEITHIRLVKP
ncbi:metallophosphoesterase [Leeia oryzae]|uniref:metallophosphoesterase n=1 Tax=Leeia oryzae TaxID=356662 RepID=UPI00037CB227|nr:metallophosphoesterase [Leeia oryzae]